jgi:hypothetical protein
MQTVWSFFSPHSALLRKAKEHHLSFAGAFVQEEITNNAESRQVKLKPVSAVFFIICDLIVRLWNFLFSLA